MANDTAHRKHRRSASDEEDDKSSKRHKHRHHRRHHRHRHSSSSKNEEESYRDQEDSLPPVSNRRSRVEDDVEEGEILEEDDSGVRAMKEADAEFGKVEADGISDRTDEPSMVRFQPTQLYVSLTSCLLLHPSFCLIALNF